MADYYTNAPERIDMVTFKSVSEGYGGLARSCRFLARISRPKLMLESASGALMQDMAYLCEATEFPGRSFNNIDVRYYGPNQKLPFQSVYEDINMTFICRNGSRERQFFDDWMWYINPTYNFNFSYKDDYTAQIDLFMLNEGFMEVVKNTNADNSSENPAEQAPSQTSASYQFNLMDAFPIMVNPQPVTWADGDFLRLTVTFTYSQWKRPSDPDANSAPSFVIGDGITVEQPKGAESKPRNVIF